MNTVFGYLKGIVFICLCLAFPLTHVAQSELPAGQFNPNLSDEEILRRLQLVMNKISSLSEHRPTYDFTTSPAPYLHHAAGQSMSFVNRYTGTLTRSIDITPGVTLSYIASGIRIDDVASWVGLGWQLQAGGVITRSVRGYPDEINSDFEDKSCSCLHWFHGWMMDEQWDPLEFDPTEEDDIARSEIIEDIIGINIDNNFLYSKFDAEPDVFTFQFNNISGSFIFDPYKNSGINEVHLIPYQNLKISYTIGSLNGKPYISSFTIKDPTGTTYIFDQKEIVTSTSKVNDVNGGNREEYVGDPPSGSFVNLNGYSGEFVQSWFLSKIILPDNKEIDLTYADEEYRQDSIIIDSYRSFGDQEIEEQLYQLCINGELSNYQDPIVQTKRLSEISSETTRIEFIADSLRRDINTGELTNETLFPRALTKINTYSIYGNEERLISQTEFSYSYYESDEVNFGYNCLYTQSEAPYLYCRLRLDSIQTYNLDEVLPPYKFTYNDDWLPARFSYCQDFWGFFNDNQDATSLIPELYVYKDLTGYRRFSPFYLGHEPTCELPGADRNPDNEDSQIGILTSLTYPSGGTEYFEYEPNSFIIKDDEDNDYQIIGGGIRIKSTSLAGITTNYSYLSDDEELTSGKLGGMPIFGYFDPTNIDCAPYYNPNPAWVCDEYNYFYVRSGYNMGESQGFLVGYDKVTETIGDGSIGSTEYYFKNQAVCCDYENVDYPWYSTSESMITPSSIDAIYYSTQSPPANAPYQEAGLDFGLNSYPYAPNIDISWYQGSISRVQNKNATGEIVSGEDYTYDFWGKNKDANSQTVPFITYGLKIGFLRNNTQPASQSCGDGYLFSSVYITSKYPIHAEIQSVVSSVHTQTKDNNQNSLEQTTVNEYNSFGQLHSVTSQLSDGAELKTIYTYPVDYWNPGDAPSPTISDPHTLAIINMANKNFFNYPVETIILRKNDPNSDFKVISGFIVLYKLYSINQENLPRPEKVLVLSLDSPLDYSTSFLESQLAGTNYTFSYDSRYQDNITYEEYDESGNIIQSKNSSDPGSNTFIFDNTGYSAISSVINATTKEISHTSFENSDIQGWTISSQGYEITDETPAKTGTYSLELPSLNDKIEKTFYLNYGANDRQGYNFSIWIKNSSLYTIRTYLYSTQLVSSTGGAGNAWTLINVSISPDDLTAYQGQSIEITVEVINLSSSSLYLDELRFCPSDALMTTYCYDLEGRLISAGSPNNLYSFYEYDDLNRNTIIRDHDKKILQLQDFHTGNPALFYCANNSNPGHTLRANTQIKVIPQSKLATSYEVDFGEGLPVISQNWQNLTHSYNNPGLYTLTLTMELDGQEYAYSKDILILPSIQ